MESNINFIDDLLDVAGKFISGEELYHKLRIKTNWIIEYKTLLKSIPKNWKDKLSLSNMNTKVKKQFRPFFLSKVKFHMNYQ